MNEYAFSLPLPDEMISRLRQHEFIYIPSGIKLALNSMYGKDAMLPTTWLFIYAIDETPFYYQWHGIGGLPAAQKAFEQHLRNCGHDEEDGFNVIVMTSNGGSIFSIHSRYRTDYAAHPLQWTAVAAHSSDR